MLRFVFGILRIPIPQFNLRFALFTPRNGVGRSIRPPAPNPRVAAERWIRALEEETGGIVVLSSSSSSEAQASASGVEVGSSTSTARNMVMTSAARGEHDGRKVLPNFIVDSYEGVLRRAQREAKIACIVLVSEEHDDDAEFKR
jgi:FAS-associated factor 2